MISIGVIKIIDNHLYIPTTRLHKEKRKRKGSEYRVYPLKRPFELCNYMCKWSLLLAFIYVNECEKFGY